MPQIETIQKLLLSTVDESVARLHSGATVVVETERLKHLIEDGYNLSMHDAGKTAWPTPDVCTWNVWLKNTWRDYEDRSGETVPQLLSAGQAKQVWERTIAKDVSSQYSEQFEYLLWNITATANRAKTAYGLMCSYIIQPSDFDDQISQDAEHFLSWLKRYQLELRKRDWIDLEALPDRFIDEADAIFESEGARIVFAGFDTWTPQTQLLAKVLIQKGCDIEILNHATGRHPSCVQKFEFEKTNDEIDTCARWARAVVELNPTVHKVGIVVARLSDVHQRLYRTFSTYLNPDSIMEKRQTHELSFHITLGTALGQTPLVVDALNLIELIRPEVDVSVMCAVIQSDRIKGWDDEAAVRSSLAEKIVGIGGTRVSIENVLTVIQNNKLNCRSLARVLHSAQKLRSQMPVHADYAYWGRFFMDWMKNFQSEKRENRKFGADEIQAHKSWGSVLESLAELGFVSSRVDVQTVMAKLGRLVSEVSIQPRARRVPVQIGEMITLAGQSFTHLWMMGMNNQALPGTPRPNPFIPIRVQKSKEIPECSAETLKKTMTDRVNRLLSGAATVVQSYSATDGKDHFQPSSELSGLQPYGATQEFNLPDYMDYKTLLSKQLNQCEKFDDWRAKPLELGADVERFRGGGSALRLQSLCPFRGFAVHRLKATQLEDRNIGISPMIRGSIVHRMFEMLYEEFPSKSEAMACGGQRYLDAAAVYARTAVEEYDSQRVRRLSREVAEIEVERLVDLARQWQDVEKGTHDDFVVYERELVVDMEVAGFPFRSIIDRIDKVDGGYLVIDYKTGNCSAGDAVGSRPRDAQLLIYAYGLYKQEGIPISDVAYVKVKRGDVRFVQLLPYLKRYRPREEYEEASNPNQRMAVWQETLETIATEFMNGNADVDPLARACDYCHLMPLCRIGEQSEETET